MAKVIDDILNILPSSNSDSPRGQQMQLTTAQLQAFKADIEGNSDQTVIDALAAGDVGVIANWYNEDSTFVVYKSMVTRELVGDALDGSNIADMTAANADRLSVFFQVVPSGVFPSRSDHRAFFEDVFSGANGSETRANLDALWRRYANKIEALFTTGTGSTADPGLLVYEGTITFRDVAAALGS